MTSTTVEVLSVRSPAMPRGARVAAYLFTGFPRWISSPAKPRQLTRAEEAADVRKLAYEMQATDPGFANDLFAAAARHESLGD